MIPAKRRAELRDLLEKATPGEWWRLQHRHVDYSDQTPRIGLDEICGLGWDWPYDDGPDDPMRGVLAKGVDAALLVGAMESLPVLLDALDDAEARERALRKLIQIMIDNDPNELIADNGMTVLDGWRESASAALAEPGP